MIVYCDTSVLIAGWTQEAHSDEVRRWFERQAHATLAVSDWTVTELHGALSHKVRIGELTEDARNQLKAAITGALRDSYTNFTVEQQDFAAAALLLDHHQSGLRSADALHLAIALGRGATLATLDRRLGEAATLHVPVDRLIPPA